MVDARHLDDRDGQQLLPHDRRRGGRRGDPDRTDVAGPSAASAAPPAWCSTRTPRTQANYGFDAETGDAADIQVNGVVYNASLTNYGADAPQDYWDGVGGGIPFYAGGTLQTGFGAGWPSTRGRRSPTARSP